MSNFFTRAFFGTDPEEDQKKLDQTDAALRALNQKRLDEGFYDKKTFDEANANLDRGAIPDVQGSIDQAFNDSLSSSTKGFRDFTGSALTFPLKLIPWQAYAIAAVVLFFYLGGGKFLKFKK